jgi:hypothetical protein
VSDSVSELWGVSLNKKRGMCVCGGVLKVKDPVVVVGWTGVGWILEDELKVEALQGGGGS